MTSEAGGPEPLDETSARASFTDDDGSVAPNVAAALAAYERGDGGPADVLAALAGGRVLVPVVAVPDEPAAAPEVGDHVDGAAQGGSRSATEMAVASTIGRDGRRGLLAFTCIESLRRWSPDAR
ncbi:SseB family protein, partial [Phytoactinopolyspora endophytica]|uniref:SseB family protein n=1 Tax=Phytoactinopolyspora endophytica TaxID=1642495 RepID=UPI0013EABB8D